MAMKGRKEFQAKLKRLTGPEFDRTVSRVLYTGADMIRAEAHRSISAGSVSGKGHVPSKPGEPPNRDTGVLQAHLEISMVAPDTAQVSSNAPYSAVHEFGGSKHPARPFLRPARDKVAPQIERLFAKEMDKLAKRK